MTRPWVIWVSLGTALVSSGACKTKERIPPPHLRKPVISYIIEQHHPHQPHVCSKEHTAAQLIQLIAVVVVVVAVMLQVAAPSITLKT